MKGYTASAAALAVLSGLIVQEVGAAPIQVTFSGVVDIVEDPDNELDASVIVGVSFSGDFTYDPVGAMDFNASSTGGSYHFDTSPMALQIGNMEFESERVYISVFNDSTDDTFGASTTLFAAPEFDHEILATIEFRDLSSTAFDSDALPTSIDLADFPDYRRFQFFEAGVPGNVARVEGEVTSITFIPEPATALLLALAVPMLRHRRPRNSVGIP